MKPTFPSWIRSRSWRWRLPYFWAMETTRRRLASTSSCLACSASISPWMIFAPRTPQIREAHVGIDFQLFQVGAMLSLRLAGIFLEFFAVGALNPLSQFADLAVERAHSVHDLI